ncbi:hypothetical protein INT48_008704 [Thamnidium elegans]|uniref:Uncharacterized protein n=1 Tax=Thamnidium elegans TaxID=101142 RepID=A0A8H7VQN3_9FUNG|nr:hypothetical protein INT48_008704 [Thamnidium elegans]
MRSPLDILSLKQTSGITVQNLPGAIGHKNIGFENTTDVENDDMDRQKPPSVAFMGVCDHRKKKRLTKVFGGLDGDTDDDSTDFLSGSGHYIERDKIPLNWYARASNVDDVSFGLKNTGDGPERSPVPAPGDIYSEVYITKEGRARRDLATRPFRY